MFLCTCLEGNFKELMWHLVWHFSKRVPFNQRPFDTQSVLTRRCWSGRSGAGERPVTNRWCVSLLHILLPVTETKHAKQNDKLRVSCNDRHLVQMQASHFKPVSEDFISIMQRTMLLGVEHCDWVLVIFFWCSCFLFCVITCKATLVFSLFC